MNQELQIKLLKTKTAREILKYQAQQLLDNFDQNNLDFLKHNNDLEVNKLLVSSDDYDMYAGDIIIALENFIYFLENQIKELEQLTK
ncbi:hypothetical protein GE118_00370 [Mycoplasma sp. NEAQ87857]|uniref:hypothetical protein n=1 Tax=Mycoplasma sp. NEAQ87857 TaxID=2683967 RepID=UPI001316EB48|nr:hypothetical protein [Mycoplasma sp. NEAQ87857]QGZ97258.1 hypothetical protein GE118_00370 [Mycoplasma sp. NEAQ87857]